MKIEIVKSTKNISNKAVYVISLFEDDVKNNFKVLNNFLNEEIKQILKEHDFKAKKLQCLYLQPLKLEQFNNLFIIGLGERKNFNLEILRKSAGKSAKEIKKLNKEIILFDIEHLDLDTSENLVTATTEGFILGLYTFNRYKTKKENKEIKNIYIKVNEKENLNKVLQQTQKICVNANLARDLVNLPSNFLTPTDFANEAKKIAGKNQNFKLTVFSKNEILKKGLNAFYAVSKGSIEEPKFIILEYQGNKKSKNYKYAFVGKGITFDSGGISLKPSKGMDEMKGDMAGGAAVLGIIKTLAELKININAVAIIPATENMPSGGAQKPGDIITAYNRTTIEVLNTDAEGRLILADALAYTEKNYGPEFIIDLATLTGAAHIALGPFAIALLGNNQELINKIISAGEKTFERCWQLPLWDEYKGIIKSEIADIKNIGDGSAGTITGAAFLSKFIKNTKWVHLDIADTSYITKEQPYFIKGATGSGVRLLVEMVLNEANKRVI